MRFWTSKGTGQAIAGENSILSGIMLMTSMNDLISCGAERFEYSVKTRQASWPICMVFKQYGGR